MFRFVLVLFLIFSFSVSASENVAYSQEWLALGHYQSDGFGGYKSSIDGEEFFLSADGRTNPQRELQATIDLFEQRTQTDKICLFPARYMFLLEKGLVKKQKLTCKEFEQFKTDLQPKGVTLLFTDAYMNNPSSLFGHTLLRVDTARQGTQLLAHGANYGAFTNGAENSVLFAVYGLTGGYYGGWTVKPYYDIINTYNNIENRDIWELELNFDERELEFLVAHLWEIGHTKTRYYFFSKNCSYMIMELLDAVRPSLQLAKEFPAQTIPLDTIKAIYRSDNLVKDVKFRPSRQAKIVHRLRMMNKKQKQALFRVFDKQDFELKSLAAEEKADVLETAYQYIQYRFVKRDYELAEYRKQSFRAVRARSKLQEQKAKISENYQGKSPLESHEAMRITAGIGHTRGNSFYEISYRPAYHSLSDNNYGLLKGAEINFLNSKWRYYNRGNKAVLQEFNLVGIKSLASANYYFRPISFGLGLDLERLYDPKKDKEGYAAKFELGGGGTIEPIENLMLFVLGKTKIGYGGFLEHNQYVAVGGSLGMFINFEWAKLLLEAEKYFATDWLQDKVVYKGELNIPLSTNWSVAIEYKAEHYHQNYKEEEFVTSIRHYF